jgi:hypothetical protein
MHENKTLVRVFNLLSRICNNCSLSRQSIFCLFASLSMSVEVHYAIVDRLRTEIQ